MPTWAATFWKARALGSIGLSHHRLGTVEPVETDGILAWSTSRSWPGFGPMQVSDEAAAIYQSFTSEGDDAITQEALYRLGHSIQTTGG